MNSVYSFEKLVLVLENETMFKVCEQLRKTSRADCEQV